MTDIAVPCPAPASETSVLDEGLRGSVTRDRVADLVRVGSLGVVIVWHSTLSLFHRGADGVLTMPNPVGSYRGLWILTWVLQVMPLFFIVSGSVNADAWNRHRQRGGTSAGFVKRRVSRFLGPLAVLVAACALAEAVGRAVSGQPFMARHLVVLVPLWTLGLLVAYAPLTAALDRAWRRFGETITVWLGSVVVLSDLVRFRADTGLASVAQVVSTVGVWLVAYQLGWVYRGAVASGAEATRATGRVLAWVGFVGLIVTTNIDVYPRPMVATTTDSMSNLLPTTVPIMMLALWQCGLLLMLRPRLVTWVGDPRVSVRLDALGRVALPAYLLHMIVVVAMVLAVEATGLGLSDVPTVGWWISRPLWLAAVVALMIPMVRASGRLLESDT
jgi:hypothetical protein